MKTEIQTVDNKVILTFNNEDENSTTNTSVVYSKHKFMENLINAFFKEERDKIKHLRNRKNIHWASVASKADEKARYNYVRYFLGGFGFSHEWVETIKKYIKEH